MGLFVQTVSLARATTKIGLTTLVYNVRRLIWLETRPAPARFPGHDPVPAPGSDTTTHGHSDEPSIDRAATAHGGLCITADQYRHDVHQTVRSVT